MMTRLLLFRFCLVALLLGSALRSFAETSPRLYAVELSAQVSPSPARITLTWPADANATGYTVDRKLPTAQTWSRVGTLAGTATSYVDAAVTSGSRYEYQVIKSVPYSTSGYGYITAGIQVNPVESRGKVVLLVDNTHAAALTNELKRLESDLVGDGWVVLRHDVARTMTPPQVKAIIKADYNADPQNVRSVFIFGHVAVPYSGDHNPDMHPDHKGAWPTDAYYADMDGVWTDTTVNTTTAEKLWNRNTPGDGKFDQSALPSAVELEVGRVDLYNMTCFANKTPSRSELDLLRQYLNKDHNYRHVKFSLKRRGLVCDNFGEMNGEAFAANGWRNFAPFFGAANSFQALYGEFFPKLTAGDYLFSYGTGGGGFYTCNGVGSSDDFAVNDVKTVFSFLFGSYFGDWDNESGFLRAPLGSTSYTLVSGWAGRPHWFMHPMGLGETIGYTARLSQNNRPNGVYRPNLFAGGTHVSLMGDPTLRLHTAIPPSNLAVTAAATGNALTWQASTDTNLVGYFVYRAASPAGPFARISGTSAVSGTTFADATGLATHAYMVRAIKLENEASGTYYNLSQGIFPGGAEVTPAPTPTPTPTPTPAPNGPAATFVSRDATSLGSWRGVYGAEGHQVIGHTRELPAYVTAGASGHTGYAWTWTTMDLSGMERTNDVRRIAYCWKSDSSFELQTLFKDDQTHRVSLYFLDWDMANRTQTVQVLNADTLAVLATETVSNFADGVYLTWDVKGRVKFRFTRVSGGSAVLSGFFFDAATVAAPAPATAAEFLGVDKTTGGTWKGSYGAEGQSIVADAATVPSYATVSAQNASQWIWQYSSADARATQRATQDSRLAACWYSGASFDVEVNVTGGAAKTVSFYCVDWDYDGRLQNVELIDAETGQVLHATSLSNFGGGAYLKYRIKGRVKARFTRVASSNAVVSGVFFDP